MYFIKMYFVFTVTFSRSGERSVLVMENADIRTHFLSFFGAGGNSHCAKSQSVTALGKSITVVIIMFKKS